LGKNGHMVVLKKRSAAAKERRKIKVKPRPPRWKRVLLQEPIPEESNGMLVDENGFPDLVLTGDEVGDPDASVLAQQEEELEEEIDLKSPEVAAELAEDPVRLYLREIGQVRLLDSDSEFRLATMVEANRLVVALRRRPLRKGTTTECAIYHSIITEMLTSWERLVEDAERLHHDEPDLGLMLTEAQTLHAGWESDAPSYLRAFLDNGRWGIDSLWDDFARKAY